MSSSTTSSAPGPTTSDTQGSGGSSSPLLFFVALGFGVVFTNLWIIVGVKYCFRYNQRNRARLAGEDADGVDLNAMPRQRRRREKKLMTIDEVNEKFPLVKYKTWRSTRADQGLPTAGGITNAASRPASIKQISRDSQDGLETKDKEPKTPTTINNEKTAIVEHGEVEEVQGVAPATGSGDRPTTANTLAVPPPAIVRSDTNEEERDPDQDDVDRIQTAIPPEQLPDPGDTCAICIDTIEDDDDIRGLSCGHAFHASCVDPWLTSRRACCPLCKADYYVPKPRPDGTQEDPRRNENPQTPHPPFVIMSSARPNYYRRGRSRPFFSGVSGVFASAPQIASDRNGSIGPGESQPDIASTAPEINGDSNPRTFRQRLPNIRMPTLPTLSRIRRGRGTEAGQQPAESTDITPAQLESGRS